MNKTELINSLSEETTFNKKDIARVLDSLVRILVRALKKGDKLQWARFGTFMVARRSARKGILDLYQRFYPFKAASAAFFCSFSRV